MSAQPPAAPETDVRLTEAERDDLIRAFFDQDHDCAHNMTDAYRLVERIVAERVRVVEGQRDALAAAYTAAPSCEAQGTCRALNESVRVLPCNAADLHRDAHVWEFEEGGEQFACFGDPDAPDIPGNAATKWSPAATIREAVDTWAETVVPDGMRGRATERFTRAEVADWFYRWADSQDALPDGAR